MPLIVRHSLCQICFGREVLAYYYTHKYFFALIHVNRFDKSIEFNRKVLTCKNSIKCYQKSIV